MAFAQKAMYGGKLIASAALSLAIAVPVIAAPVLMISVDGLKPEYVFEAEKRDLKIPFLRSLLRNGTYASGVIGVWRVSGPTSDLNPSDRYLIAALSRPDGLLPEMQKTLGPYLMANDTSLRGDEAKTRYAIACARGV